MLVELQTNGQTDNPITGCPLLTFQARALKESNIPDDLYSK